MMIYADYHDRLNDMFKFGWEWLDAPLFSSLLVMLVLLILGVVIGIKAHKAVKKGQYKEAPRGLLFWADAYYDYVTNFTVGNMGKSSMAWSGYFWVLFAYLFLSFNASLFGIPSVIDWLPAPLCLAVIMFTLIQVTAIKYQHWHYFHRYIEPIAAFLPVNLITMWSPIISTTMRMFGNCLAGTIIITLVQWALSNASAAIFSAMNVSLTIPGIADNWQAWWNTFPYWTGTILSPIPMGVLNLYFSLFSGFVQTLVFCSLTSLWIAQEKPTDEEQTYVDLARIPSDLLVEQAKESSI